MPRLARSWTRGFAYHVLNRGNERRRLFVESADYCAFLSLLSEAPRSPDVKLLAYCVLPNHWHLVLIPQDLPALSAYIQWITGTHALRWRRDHGVDSPGHVYQGRFKSVPILTDQHLLTALRYVEANPVRAGLTVRARDWQWSSISASPCVEAPALAAWPLPRPTNWERHVDAVQSPEQLHAIRTAIRRGTPIAAVDGSPLQAQLAIADSPGQPALF